MVDRKQSAGRDVTPTFEDRLTDVELPISVPTPSKPTVPGPLHGLRIVELANPFCAFAGKLLADAGADVIVVEPPEGSEQRWNGPFADDIDDEERSLSWWANNTSKRSAVADLETGPGRQFFRQLIATADVLLEAEPPGRLAELGVDYTDLTGLPMFNDESTSGEPMPGPPPINENLIHLAITPLGRRGGEVEATDLTVLARGGPLWSCGYDDHGLPPVRGGGNQGIKISAHFAVMSTMTALLARDDVGGQFVDISMVAAANVTTEFASYSWLAARQTVQRQTGRHAAPSPTEPTQVQCADGRYLNTGVPPRTPHEFGALRLWLEELGFEDEFALINLLDLGQEYELITLEMIREDPLAGEVFQAGRQAMAFVASKISAHEAFIGFQTRGIAAGVVWSIEETMSDPHFQERGFPTPVYQPEIDREVLHPGPPIRFTKSPMAIRNAAPRLGEHTSQIKTELDSLS